VPNYLEPEDDGLPIRDFGPWVVEKLDYLKRYIEIFENSMHAKPWRERHFIDLFAGTGKCHVVTTRRVCLGSSLLAIKTTHPFTHYFFVDKEPENIAVLRERCNASPISSLIECEARDGNDFVREIVEHIQQVDQRYIPGAWSSLNLAFLDPDGLELKWETVATLANVRTMDLIIHYPQRGLTRNMGAFIRADETTPADLFFGGTEWREIYERYQSREEGFLHRELMDHYKGKLQQLGYRQVFRDDETGDEPLTRNSRHTPLYRLLFASKNPLGNDFWQKVTRRDAHGQIRLF
jgi:three-Cys-motif partner protein